MYGFVIATRGRRTRASNRLQAVRTFVCDVWRAKSGLARGRTKFLIEMSEIGTWSFNPLYTSFECNILTNIQFRCHEWPLEVPGPVSVSTQLDFDRCSEYCGDYVSLIRDLSFAHADFGSDDKD
jgi:hypothetical protein